MAITVTNAVFMPWFQFAGHGQAEKENRPRRFGELSNIHFTSFCTLPIEG